MLAVQRLVVGVVFANTLGDVFCDELGDALVGAIDILRYSVVDRLLMNPMRLILRMRVTEVLLDLWLEVLNILDVGEWVSVLVIQIFS